MPRPGAALATEPNSGFDVLNVYRKKVYTVEGVEGICLEQQPDIFRDAEPPILTAQVRAYSI